MRRVGYWLRRIADRIDRPGAPKVIGWRFTFERHKGIVFNNEERGARLLVANDEEYDRAWNEGIGADYLTEEET